jgi:hypothetical protein
MNYYPRDYKLGQVLKTDVKGYNVDESFIAHIQVVSTYATAGSTTNALTLTTLNSATAITTGITNPGVPRNVRAVGNAAGIVGSVVIKGTNFNGDAISETLTLNGTTMVEGNKAFKTITEIDLPAKANASGDAVSLGYGEKLGLPYKLIHNTVLYAYLNNVKEGTTPTVTTSTTALENNTIDLASALNGTVVDVYLVV